MLYEILISGQKYESSYSECPHHVLQWISSKVEVQIALTLLYWRVAHAPFVQDIRQYRCVSTYQNSDNDSIYLAVALRYSKSVDNSEQIRSQAALKILVYGSKA